MTRMWMGKEAEDAGGRPGMIKRIEYFVGPCQNNGSERMIRCMNVKEPSRVSRDQIVCEFTFGETP